MSKRKKQDKKIPIAIIGIGCRFPGGGETPEDFWQMLLDMKDGISSIPKDRWDAEAFYHPDYNTKGKMQVKEGGFIDDIDKFDAQFFGIAPVEAMRMDPQQRILLEQTYYAFEDAGLTLEQMEKSRTGVFVGISSTDYAGIQNNAPERPNIGAQTNTGGAASIAANRISYAFDLRGPSFAVDTACSSGLVATHTACRSIQNGDADMAIVGGVNILIRPEVHIGFSTGGFLSPDCRCKTFDASANGYVRSEGAGVVILKPLDKAIEDNDRIYATIIGSALNEDGHTGGISMPNPEAQVDVLKKAYNDAGINPEVVDFVEAHGTGTAVGDPIECNSIAKVLGGTKELLIGSVKSNIGHLEPASGLAGMIKTALSLKNRQFPANIHFKNPNPDIDFKELGIKVPTQTEPLRKKGKPITAGINSFGFGGANAHVVMQSHSAAVNKKTQKPSNPLPLLLSARSESSLKELAKAYKKLLRNTDINLTDLCCSVATKRSALEIRAAIPAIDRKSTVKLLDNLAKGKENSLVTRGRTKDNSTGKTAFVFSGQGPQWFAMGRELLENNKIFSEAIEEIDKILKKLGWLKKEKSSLTKELKKNEKTSRIKETEIAQPAIFAIQVALFRLWDSLGVTPDGIIGHSIGEVAAAQASGSLSLEESTRIVYWRSKCQSPAAGKGKMLAVGMTTEQAEEKISNFKGKIDIAAINSPEMLTLAGETEALEELAEILESENIFNRFLVVDVPFHSFLLNDIIDDFKNKIKNVKTKKNKIELFSTVKGKSITGKQLTANYWAKNIRQPVLFYPTVQEMVAQGYDTFIEISPHPILSHGLNAAIENSGSKGLLTGSLRRKEPEIPYLLSSLGKLFCNGRKIDFNKLFATDYKYIQLPHYPWKRERYWLESPESLKQRMGTRVHPHLTGKTWSPQEPGTVSWDVELDHRTHPYIDDHRVQGPLVYPGAGHVDLALGVARASFGDDFGFLEDLEFMDALFLPDEGDPYKIQISVSSDEGEYAISTLKNRDDKNWTIHSKGKINHIGDQFISSEVDLKKLKKRIKNPVELDPLFDVLEKGGLLLGPSFKGLKELWSSEGESLGRIEIHENITHDCNKYNIHPALLDASFQTAFGIIAGTDFEGVYIPIKIKRIKFYKTPDSTIFSYARAASYSDDIISADIWIMDDKGEILLEIQGFTAKYLKGSRGEIEGQLDELFYNFEWKRKDREDQITDRKQPEYMPSPKQLKKPLNDRLTSIKEKPIFSQFLNDLSPVMENLAFGYMIDSLSNMGMEFKKGKSYNPDSLAKKFKIVKSQRNLYNRILSHLTNKKILEKDQNKLKVNSVPSIGATEEKAIKYIEKLPQFSTELKLLKLCGSALADILQGKTDPIELLFSAENRKLITDYYSEAYTFTKYHELILAAVDKIISKLPEHRTLRVLEVGAGTGGITKMILSLFPTDRTEYFFSDISFEFMQLARQRFAEFPFLSFQSLDITKDIEKQDFKPGSFDLVIASNVVHSTPDVLSSLKNIRKLLADGGSLVMLEVTQTSIYPDLIFGLTEGWWNYLKDPLKRESCSLEPEQWQQTFIDAGFNQSIGLTDIEKVTDEYPRQHVFICRAETSSKRKKIIEKSEPGRYWIVPDSSGTSDKIRKKLTSQGHQVEFKTSKEILETEIPSTFSGIIYCNGIDIQDFKKLSSIEIKKSIKEFVYPLGKIADKLEETPGEPELWIVTSGAAALEGNDLISIEQTPLIGLGRVIFNELRSINTRLVDLSSKPEKTEIDQLIEEINAPQSELSEEEIAFRDKKRLVRRLNRFTPKQRKQATLTDLPAKGSSFKLENGSGLIEELTFRITDLKEPSVNEISVDVDFSALNFRDVMLATGSLPEKALKYGFFGPHFGLECSGKVTEIGRSVKGIKIGDRVMALGCNCISGKVNIPANFAIKIPSKASSAEASILPMAYLTAYYSLVKVANLQYGEKILIHAAAGGVGLAAVNIARLSGAEIYVTAGKKKHNFLKESGIKHIYDSRTPAFYDEIMEDTDAKGVDVVLNSLSGKLLTQSLKSLGSGGRFVEIGKNDIFNDKRINLQHLSDNSSFQVVDIDRLLLTKPKLMEQCLNELFNSSSKYVWQNKKLIKHPYSRYSICDFASAFREMAKGNHIGKIVLSLEEKVAVQPKKELHLNPKGSYLVAGGTGGFGLVVGKFLAKKGAGKVILASRSGKVRPEDKKLIDDIKENGTEISVRKLDVANRNHVKKLVKEINQSKFPLKGVFQSAMVLSDAFIKDMDWEKFAVPIDSKIEGTWNLHIATKKMNLDYFVTFSSIASVYGTPGQSNYAAANNFLDTFPHYRKRLGLPCQTVNWGAIAEMGYVARTEEIKDFLGNHGWREVSLANVLNALEKVMLGRFKQTGVFDVDWKVFAETFPHNANSGRIAHLHNEDDYAVSSGRDGVSLADRLKTATPSERPGIADEVLRTMLSRILGMPKEKIDSDTPITRMGIDSLMANQIRSWLTKETGIPFSLMQIMQGPTISELNNEIVNGMNIKIESSNNKSSSPWFLKPQPVENPEYRIFCFSYMGVGGSVYNGWEKLLPENVELVAIQIPGREERIEETPITDTNELFTTLAKEMLPLLDVPFIFYGHSFGGNIAMNFAAYLEEVNKKIPKKLFVGASIPKNVINPLETEFELAGPKAKSDINEEGIIKLLKKLGTPDSILNDPEKLKNIIPAVKGDLKLSYQGDRYKDTILPCPITAIAGEKDNIYSPEMINNWKAHTEDFKLEKLPGSHLFIHEKESLKKLINIINKSLKV